MNKITTTDRVNWFSKPYPLIQDISINLALSFGLSIISFIFLFVFKPFGLHIVHDVLFFAGFGLPVLISCILHFFILPKIFKFLFDADQWKIYNQLLFIASITFFVSIFNYFYNSTIGKNISPQYNFFEFIYMTSLVGALPILTMIYVTEIVANRRNKAIAKEIKIYPNEINNNNIIFQGENQKDDTLSLGIDQFIYAQSSQNYCTIYYLFEGQLQYKMLRISLKNIMLVVPKNAGIVRCHKSFAINKRHIHEISGNARSLIIQLYHVDNEIPVSRNFDTSALYNPQS